MIILGGLGSIIGSVLGAILLTVLPEALRGFAQYRMVIYSLLLIILMITRPQGLLGSAAALKNWRKRFKKTAKPADAEPKLRAEKRNPNELAAKEFHADDQQNHYPFRWTVRGQRANHGRKRR
jgi:MFS family permease